MVVTINDLNAQVNVALEFLDSVKGQDLEFSKARYCIVALKEKLNEFAENHKQLEQTVVKLSSKNESNYIKLSRIESEKKELLREKELLESDMDSLRNELTKQLNKLTASVNERERLEGQISNMRCEINGLNKTHKTELEEAKATAKSKSKAAVDREKQKVKKLNGEVTNLKTQIKSYEDTIESMHGKKTVSVEGVTKGVRFFIHEYEVPISLVLRDNVNRMETIGGLPWHIQVMRNNGVSVAAMVSEWLTPIFPMCKDFNEEWDEKNTLVIHAIMMERAKATAKREYTLTLAAKKFTITNHDNFTKEEQDWFKKAKMITLFDAIGLCYPIFAYDIEKANKGITSSQISDLHNKLKSVANGFVAAQEEHFRKAINEAQK